VVFLRDIDQSQSQTINYEIAQIAMAMNAPIGKTFPAVTYVRANQHRRNAFSEDNTRSNASSYCPSNGPRSHAGAVVTTTENGTTRMPLAAHSAPG
jgi:hypothetical protein